VPVSLLYQMSISCSCVSFAGILSQCLLYSLYPVNKVSSIPRILSLCLLYSLDPVTLSPRSPLSCPCASSISTLSLCLLYPPYTVTVYSIPCILSPNPVPVSPLSPISFPCVSSIPHILFLCLLFPRILSLYPLSLRLPYPPNPVPVSPLFPHILSPLSPLSLSPPWFAGVDRNATYCATHTHTRPETQGLRPVGKVVRFQPLRPSTGDPIS
jgi:hypothetical protein